MGDKVEIPPVGNPENSSFVTKLNEAVDELSDEFDNVVYRDGSQSMTGDLDMGSRRIFNLAAPLTDGEPLRRLDIPFALQGQPGIQGPPGDVAKSATRAALVLAATSNGAVRFLEEAGRSGFFIFSTDNLSAQVTADPQQAIYVAPTVAPTGVLGAWVRSYSGPVDVRWFGAKAETAFNNLVAFQAAAVLSNSVFVPPGIWEVAGTTNISLSGSVWRGAGKNITVIQSTSTSAPIFTASTGIFGISVSNMTLDRSAVPVAGANGIDFSGFTLGQSLISQMLIKNQYIGLAVGPTDWSEIEHVICQNNYNAGLRVSNTAADGACQWSMDTVLCQRNGAQGFLIQAVVGPSQMTIGTYKNCAGFANSGIGFAFQGLASCPIQGIRMNGGFFGEDGNHAVYLDTHGGQHMLTGVFTELAGIGLTGRLFNTPSTNVGSGFHVTTNNHEVQFSGCQSVANSHHGFLVNAGSNVLGNCVSLHNGQILLAGSRSGVHSTNGRVLITGGRFGNRAGGTQQYGAYVSDGNNLSIGFADLDGNSVAAWSAVSNLPFVTSIGNLPNTLNVGLSPQGAVLLGGAATGDFNAAGTMNVAGGILKNDIGYVNP